MSDVQAKSPKPSTKARRNKPILGIRGRLIVVALVAIAPLMAERVRDLERARGEHVELARSQVVDSSRAAAPAQREVVSSMRVGLVVGLDEAAVHNGIDREIGIAYLQLGLFGVFVLLAAWFGGERLILRPICSLARVATRLGGGDLQVRATEEPWLAGFEPIATAFDDMARKLAAREKELQIANQHLEELASLDGLTGLANRRGFDRQLEREWRQAAQQRRPLALMMIDIDHFKLLNDRYGHVRGDACLRAVAETLSLIMLDAAVLVARYGGEEFALLLPGFDLGRATALAEQARRAIEDLLITHDETPCGFVTISIGVDSLVPAKNQSPADLVKGADGALYAAKRRGRNAIAANAPLLWSAAS
jgi:diguanylate cyclase (GGDEF)-like protein